MKIFFYVLTIIGVLIGTFFLSMVFTVAESAAQEASLAAIAVAFAVLPYCFARAIEGISRAQTSNIDRALNTLERIDYHLKTMLENQITPPLP